MRGLLLVTVVGAFLLAASVCWSGIPHLIHYQGMLTDDEGTPLNTPQDISFTIYNDSTGGTLKWTETQYGIMVTDGLFNVNLGDSTLIDLAFDEDYWLEMDVGPGEILTPRVQLTSVGYAYRAERTDTASYAHAGPGVADNDWNLRITDTADTTLMTGGGWGIARSGNVLHGSADSTHVNLGLACTTGASGQNRKYCTVGGGYGNISSGEYTTVAGKENTAGGYCATVGGGLNNTASGNNSTVAGGSGNIASVGSATVGGGGANSASGLTSTVAGGYADTASGNDATVGGGDFNTASGDDATVGGGDHNMASGLKSTVAGGYADTASGEVSTVGGGNSNKASMIGATVGGGRYNTASGWSSTVGGGEYNRATALTSTVAGGYMCHAYSEGATVAGGVMNDALHNNATVGGGYNNTASGGDATVGGGSGNLASGSYSTVPGGRVNTASGNYSFAAGYRAKASHNGTFVWGDSTQADFVSTGQDQFLIRASGGVGIGTNSPQGALDVSSTMGAFIVPRMTTAQRDALSAVNGMIIYNTTDNQFNFYENGSWVAKQNESP